MWTHYLETPRNSAYQSGREKKIRYPAPKRFEVDTSSEDSPIFEAKPRELSQCDRPGKQGKTSIRKHVTLEETRIKYIDQALTKSM